jgi:pyruvate/2-oxoacid:ferredoxin oxidoreductase alpha subunit
MQLALEIIEKVFAKFEEYFGRRYSFLYEYNVPSSKVVFVVAGAANGTFEEVARELHRAGVDVGVVHPNVLRPFPGQAWVEALKGRRVFVYDRDDPFGAVGGRLYTELAGVVNEHDLAATGTRLYSRIYGLGGRTPTISLVRDEIIKALREEAGGLHLALGKEYVGVSL